MPERHSLQPGHEDAGRAHPRDGTEPRRAVCLGQGTPIRIVPPSCRSELHPWPSGDGGAGRTHSPPSLALSSSETISPKRSWYLGETCMGTTLEAPVRRATTPACLALT